jgi:hypothetical protein
MEKEERILLEIEQIEKESEELLKGIDMENISEEDTEKVQAILDKIYEKVQAILDEPEEKQ